MNAPDCPVARNVDGKGRVVLPHECRAMLNGIAAVVPATAPVPALLIRKPEEIRTEGETAEYRHWSITYGNAAFCPVCPVTGRILIPELLRRYLGLTRFQEVVIRGAAPVFELLTFDAWRRMLQEETP